MDSQIYTLPTGKLIVDQYERGPLETLSIGDYGKAKNIKADFLGYTRELNGVENGDCMPLSEKWVITVSTQHGCAMNCTFCDVPNIKFAGNVSFNDLKRQLYSALSTFPNVKYTDRLNLHYARMGDPIFNEQVFEFSEWLIKNKQQFQKETGVRVEVLHPVFTTMMPDMKYTAERVRRWVDIKNNMFNGQAGLQLSINSTCEDQRSEMFRGKQLTLEQISDIVKDFPTPLGRKYCLNIAYSTDFIVDADKLSRLFDPENWMVKITPIHNNEACTANNIETMDGYESYAPYRPVEEELKAAGFDVLIFIPSFDEEDGIVTCGNAILGGSVIKSDVQAVKIEGQYT